jgi:transcriptional regulator with XRE-family HTH domain
MTEEDKQIVSRFATQMRTYREAKGISQEKLAEYANLHRTYIGSIERAEKIPSLITIVKISKALNINISELITY